MGTLEAVELLRSLAPDGIAVSIITYMESVQGTLRTPPTYTPERFQAFFDTVPILPLSAGVAERCARIRENLGQQGRRVRPRALDLIIAATALEHNLILVTRNEADYRDIPGLRLYEPPETEDVEN